MQITVIVPANQIVSRGRPICRLQGCTHIGFWRRAAESTWRVTQVSGSRDAGSGDMVYVLTLARGEWPEAPHADFSCLEGYSVTVPEPRRRSPGSDAETSDAAEPTDTATEAPDGR